MADRTRELNFALLTDRLETWRAGRASVLAAVCPELFRGSGRDRRSSSPTPRSVRLFQAMLHGLTAGGHALDALYAHIQGAPGGVRRRRRPRHHHRGGDRPSRPVGTGQPSRPRRDPPARHPVDAGALSLALRSGMREVVAEQDLAASPRRSSGPAPVASAIGQTMTGGPRRPPSRRRPTMPPRPRPSRAAAEAPSRQLSTVFSTKGGVGKSLVATNLGRRLGEIGDARVPGRPRRQQR